MTGCVLTINAGYSSLKFALYDNNAALTATLRGEIEHLGAARDNAGKVIADKRWQADAKQSFADSLNITAFHHMVPPVAICFAFGQARRTARFRGQRRQCNVHQHAGKPRRSPCHSHRRGGSDRPAPEKST